ncbi:MAG: ABC transporter substrate-binding protein [Deltaproteobacteria bacterium]|nr:ABC transporter substrate-binding protein [Deltaproteobacteria bacterium]
MNYARTGFLVLCLSAVLGLTAGPSAAQDKIRLGFSGIGVGAEIHHLAADTGLFSKQGLDVEIIYIPAGSMALQTMIAGEISIGWGNDGAGVISSIVAGYPMKMIAILVNKFVYSFVTPPSITRPQDLKGKAVAVSRFGAGSDFVTRMALKSWGLEAGKDVTILQIGNSPARLGALASGRVQGSILNLSQTPRAKKSGLRVLADLSQIDVDYPQGVVYVTPAMIEKRPDLLARFMRAYLDAISQFKSNRQVALNVIAKHTGLTDREEAAEYYEVFSKNFLQDRPVGTLAGLKTLLEDVGAKNPKVKDIKPQDILDTRFIPEQKGK